MRYFKLLLVIFIVAAFTFTFTSCSRKEEASGLAHSSSEKQVDYYTCGMHPSVRVSPKEFDKGSVNCPICNMKLVPVYSETAQSDDTYYGCGVDTEGQCPHCDFAEPDKLCICGQHSFIFKGEEINCPVCNKPLKELTQDEVDKLMGVVSRVKIKAEQARLAGVKTEPVQKQHLYKKIRTVGKVAYDPELAITQEEFISSLRALDKVAQGSISEIKERTLNLVTSAKRKLILLGLSEEQIKELERTRIVQTNLILPEEKMWIYGDVYEYELGWVKQGAEVKVTTTSLPGEEFRGVISSLNPVLDPKTRSIKFRAEVDNPNLTLRPQMYVDVMIMSMYLSPEGEQMVLAVAKDAVLDTGRRKVVWIDKGSGTYEGREIKLGLVATAVVDEKEQKFYPVLRGLREGERVVTKANFLIDSQSQLSGVAASSYGGALGIDKQKGSPKGASGHQH